MTTYLFYLLLGVVVFVLALFAFMHWRGKKRYKQALAQSTAARAGEAAPAPAIEQKKS